MHSRSVASASIDKLYDCFQFQNSRIFITLLCIHMGHLQMQKVLIKKQNFFKNVEVFYTALHKKKKKEQHDQLNFLQYQRNSIKKINK